MAKQIREKLLTHKIKSRVQEILFNKTAEFLYRFDFVYFSNKNVFII